VFYTGFEERPVEDPFESANEPLGFVRCWDVLEWLHI
jgi:hypothetical protein